MSVNVVVGSIRHTVASGHVRDTAATRYLVPVGRALYATIFLAGSLGHFSRGTIEQAAHQGVPLASVVVPASGALALLGGLSVLIGYRVRVGAAMLALFLVPVTVTMHAFWAVPDAQAAQLQSIMFFKNVGLLGGALLMIHFGAGPFSADARREKSGEDAARLRQRLNAA
jgi:putative oxidoreductase